MPYSKEEIKHLAFVRRIREKNAVQYLADRDVYLTEWINNPASRGGQENYAGQANYGWKSNNGKLLPGQVLNMAPKTEVNGKMVYNLYQDIQTGNMQAAQRLMRQLPELLQNFPSEYRLIDLSEMKTWILEMITNIPQSGYIGKRQIENPRPPKLTKN